MGPPRLARDHFGSGPHGDDYTTTSLYFETPGFDVYHRAFVRAQQVPHPPLRGGRCRVPRAQVPDEPAAAKRRTTVPILEMEQLAAERPRADWCGYWFHRRVLLRRLSPLIQNVLRPDGARGHGERGPMRMTIDTHLRVLPMPDRAFIPRRGLPLIQGSASSSSSTALKCRYLQGTGGDVQAGAKPGVEVPNRAGAPSTTPH